MNGVRWVLKKPALYRNARRLWYQKAIWSWPRCLLGHARPSRSQAQLLRLTHRFHGPLRALRIRRPGNPAPTDAAALVPGAGRWRHAPPRGAGRRGSARSRPRNSRLHKAPQRPGRRRGSVDARFASKADRAGWARPSDTVVSGNSTLSAAVPSRTDSTRSYRGLNRTRDRRRFRGEPRSLGQCRFPVCEPVGPQAAPQIRTAHLRVRFPPPDSPRVSRAAAARAISDSAHHRSVSDRRETRVHMRGCEQQLGSAQERNAQGARAVPVSSEKTRFPAR